MSYHNHCANLDCKECPPPAEALDFEAAYRKTGNALPDNYPLIADALNAQHRAALARVREEYQGRVTEYREAANWVLHVVSGVGKDGNPPSSSEETAAFDALKKCLEAP